MMDKRYFYRDQREIEPEVFVLKMAYSFMINYSYVIVDSASRKSLIIDPSWDIEGVIELLQNIGATLEGVLLTHSHYDHLYSAKPLSDKYGCPIWMSQEEIAFSGFSAPRLLSISEKRWSVGGLDIFSIYTPGHTIGSVCYLIGNNLFTGDTLFAEGCGLCHDIVAAHNMFNSLQSLIKILDVETSIYPGHSYGIVPGQKFSFLLRNNMYLQFKNKEDFTSYRLRKGQNKLSFFDFK